MMKIYLIASFNAGHQNRTYQRVPLTLMLSAVQLYHTGKCVCAHEGQQQGPHTEETLGVSESL